MEKEVKKLFDDYNQNFEKLSILLKDELPRSLKLFNIRFRLALDIMVDFKGEVSLTKTKEVRDTYVLLAKLMESWNAYEALFHYVKETKKYANVKTSIYKAYSEAFLTEVGSMPVLKESLDNIKTQFANNDSFKKDFKQYIQKIIDNENIVPSLTDYCKRFIDCFEKGKKISGIEIIALIYTERNMYYHNGETAKMGISYKNRQYLLKTLTASFHKHILLLITKILEKEYQEKK